MDKLYIKPFDVNCKDTLTLGYEREHYAWAVRFDGFEMRDPKKNVLYFKIDMREMTVPVPLVDYMFPVTFTLTKKRGKYKGQLEEYAPDGTLVHESKVFKVVIDESIPLEGEYEITSPDADMWAVKLKELENDLEEKLASGYFKGEKGDRGERGPQGLNGVVIPTNGMYTMDVEEDGNLVMYYNDADEAPDLSINEDGYLVFGEDD